MTIQEFIHAKGLETIADEMHKHPKSGSDWSIRQLLESYQKQSMPDMFSDFLNSSSDACSLEASAAERTDAEWRDYFKSQQ